MRYKLLQKRFTGKTTDCSKHLRHIAIEKDILSELNRCIFQHYIKLVIPKILFILVLCSFNFYFKITWPLPTKLPPPPPSNIIAPTKIKMSDPPSKDFSEIFNLSPPKLERGCMPWKKDKNSFSFYFQKAQTIPVLNTSTAWEHQLTLYEGIHDQANNQGNSHLLCENTGWRGSSKIASILHAFVKNHCNLNELTFWCDNCGG